jgi:hypothetical protein
LGNYCKLPSGAISANVQALLRDVWPLAAAIGQEQEGVADWDFTSLGLHKNDCQPFEQLLYIG